MLSNIKITKELKEDGTYVFKMELDQAGVEIVMAETQKKGIHSDFETNLHQAAIANALADYLLVAKHLPELSRRIVMVNQLLAHIAEPIVHGKTIAFIQGFAGFTTKGEMQ